MCVCGIPPQPTMLMYYSRISLNLLVCVHLLCLLLLFADFTSSRASEDLQVPPPNPQSQLNVTQANCSTACDNGSVSENATTKESSKNSASDMQKNLSSGSASTSQIKKQLSLVPVYLGRDHKNRRILDSKTTQEDQSSTSSSTSNGHTSVSHKFNDTVTFLVTPKQSSGGNRSSTALPFSQQPVPPDHLLPPPERVTQTTAVLHPTTTGSPTQAANTGTNISTGAVHTVSTLVTPTTTTPTSTRTTSPTSKTAATAHPTTTKNATTALPNANSVVTITTGRKMLPSSPSSSSPSSSSSSSSSSTSSSSAVMPQPNVSSTGMTPIQPTSASKAPATIIVSSAITTTKHNEPFGAGTRVTIVEVEGSLLTRQLVDTASLLSVLLFGLLFLLVTVAVFVTQAYESYRRKDYTQVDYLINGMYTDSGV